MEGRGPAPPAIDGFRHEALLYSSDDELLEVAVPFLRAGIAAREPTLLRLPAHQQAAVLDALHDDGCTVVAHPLPRTPLTTLRATHDLVERLTADGGGRARMFGDIPHDPWTDWVRYEAAVNVLLRPLPVWGLCPYDTRTTPASVVADVERTHPVLSTRDLAGTANRRFRDPLAFLEDHARRPDALRAQPPDLEIIDPSPQRAGRVVGILADATRLDFEDRESLRLGTTAVVENALAYGRPPVVVRVWTTTDRVMVTVADAGPGTDVLRGVLSDGPSVDANGSLYHVREAVSEVSMFWDADGFTVRLVQHRH